MHQPQAVLTLATLLWMLGSAAVAHAGSILFVRGGEGTVGFLEGFGGDQAASIFDFSTSNGNHGWGTLAVALETDGHTLTQLQEGPRSNNTPIPFDQMDLERFDTIVLGSNNADYTTAQVDAVESFVRNGGGLLVISDANFGLSWQDASNSDQQFLDRFGLVMNQDHGTYQVRRSNGDYRVSDHPILEGVDSFMGEGVTPITRVANPPSEVFTEVIARVPNGQDFRVNPGDRQGGLVDPTVNDGTLVVATAGHGRVACHFDRNTFFNRNGAGTDIHEHDNERYARNLFNWLVFASVSQDSRPRSVSPNLSEEGGKLTIRFEVPKSPSPRIVYEILAADGLAEGSSWNSIARKSGSEDWSGIATIRVEDLEDGHERVQIEDTKRPSSSMPRFLRLVVSLNP